MKSVVKHSYISAGASAVERALAHIRYIQHRPGKDRQEVGRRVFFDAQSDDISARAVQDAIKAGPRRGSLIHKLIISPGAEHIVIEEYVREMMADLASQKALDLVWFAVKHVNTLHPHCHIVLLGTDRNGRRVFLNKADYARAREVGDRHIERSPIKDHRTEKSQMPGAGLLARLQAVCSKAAREWWQSVAVPDPSRTGSTLPTWPPLEDTIGRAPQPEDLLIARERFQLRRRLRERKQRQLSTRPIFVNYAQGVQSSTAQYTRLTPLFALRELERDYLAGEDAARSSMSPDDLSRLQSWIKEQWIHRKQIAQDASRISRLELHFSDHESMTVNSSSPPTILRELKDMHLRGDIVLMDAEAAAIDRWINEHDDAWQKRQSVTKPMSSPAKDKSTAYQRLKERINPTGTRAETDKLSPPERRKRRPGRDRA